MKNFLSISICLILLTIRNFDESNEKVVGKMKGESEGKIIDEFVRLKSKICSMKNIGGKESNTAKGVNISIEFKEFKGILFDKK